VKIGIIAAMAQEVKTLVEQLDSVEKSEIANQTFYNGTIFGKEVTLVQSGIGKVNATLGAALLIQHFKVEAVINTGSAGGIGKGLSVGELVVSTELAYNDADAQVFGYAFGQIPQMPERYIADNQLITQVKEAASETNWKVETGLIVSGDSFISSDEMRQKILDFFPEALVTEMEGAAVAQTCYQFDVPFVVVRALSDTADEKASVSFDEFIDEAGKHSAQLVLRVIESMN
jgi:adenosylhomocysteine nucleosidase